MRLPKCLGRRAYEPPKELDEVGRPAQAEKLADRDLSTYSLAEWPNTSWQARAKVLVDTPTLRASSATDGRAWTRSSSARRRRRISVACAVGADG